MSHVWFCLSTQETRGIMLCRFVGAGRDRLKPSFDSKIRKEEGWYVRTNSYKWRKRDYSCVLSVQSVTFVGGLCVFFRFALLWYALCCICWFVHLHQQYLEKTIVFFFIIFFFVVCVRVVLVESIMLLFSSHLLQGLVAFDHHPSCVVWVRVGGVHFERIGHPRHHYHHQI